MTEESRPSLQQAVAAELEARRIEATKRRMAAREQLAAIAEQAKQANGQQAGGEENDAA